MLWSNLLPEIDAATIARLYRKRWRIEGMIGRLESVLHSEIKTLGHPRAALLGSAVAVLAYKVLALLKQLIEHTHRQSHPELDVSTDHLVVDMISPATTGRCCACCHPSTGRELTTTPASSWIACCCWAAA